MAKILNGTGGSWNKRAKRLINDNMFDFIAIQESMNATIIHNNMEISYKNQYTEITHGQINRAGITIYLTIFLNNKYKLVSTSPRVNVQYVGSLFGDAGRPIQIIYVQHKSTNKYYIFINLHNAHSKSRRDLEIELFKHIDLFIKSYPIINYQDYSIIISGDFNDHRGYNYFNGLSLLDGIIYRSIPPPKTCCVGSSSIRGSKGEDPFVGDYTLSNYVKNPITKVFIPLSDPWYNSDNYPASDHLPCVTIMDR